MWKLNANVAQLSIKTVEHKWIQYRKEGANSPINYWVAFFIIWRSHIDGTWGNVTELWYAGWHEEKIKLWPNPIRKHEIFITSHFRKIKKKKKTAYMMWSGLLLLPTCYYTLAELGNIQSSIYHPPIDISISLYTIAVTHNKFISSQFFY